MKRLFLLILSFMFLGGAVTGSALLLSACDYEQTESGGGNSQNDILDETPEDESKDEND